MNSFFVSWKQREEDILTERSHSGRRGSDASEGERADEHVLDEKHLGLLGLYFSERLLEGLCKER